MDYIRIIYFYFPMPAHIFCLSERGLMKTSKLYLVHCGYYDPKICDGLFESHANLFVVADSFDAARAEAKKLDAFQQHKMHIDGLQQINAVRGFESHSKISPRWKAGLSF